jgi:mRNA interferase RelE/StbE
MVAHETFQQSELESIDSGLMELAKAEIPFQPARLVAVDLVRIWAANQQLVREADEAYGRPARPMRDMAVPRFPHAEPDWDLGLTHEFRKAIKNIDRKLQGRVLQALDYISSKPTVPRGDTVKPLSGEYEGPWRYRIGDYRLIYRPDTDTARVVLITVVSRGAAYA